MYRRRARSLSRLAVVLAAYAGLVLAAACAGRPEAGGVHVLTARGEINPAMANYLRRGLDQARDAQAQAVVIALDTSGGLDSSMRVIMQAIGNSAVPVIVYVAPSGGRAASAGTFITLAGHLAAMAPNTTIGAAHPVSITGQNIDSTLDTKIENDAVAYIRGIAELRGRNADWAEQAVRQSVSVSEAEAVRLHVVDLVAPSLAALLHEADGRTVRLNDGTAVRLATAGAPLRDNGPSLFERFLLVVSDPNIAFLLLSLGSLALLIELFNPTLALGLAGAVSVILGLFALGALPVNWAGVALMGLAMVLLAAELALGSYGLLGVAGLLSMAAGGLLLTSTDNPQFQVSRWLVVAIPALVGVAIGGVAIAVLGNRGRATAVGAERLVGASGVVRAALDPAGIVIVHGERWQASAERPIAEGERVIVTGREGLHLTVRPEARAEDEAGSR